MTALLPQGPEHKLIEKGSRDITTALAKVKPLPLSVPSSANPRAALAGPPAIKRARTASAGDASSDSVDLSSRALDPALMVLLYGEGLPRTTNNVATAR
jgi:hypothetical protein